MSTPPAAAPATPAMSEEQLDALLARIESMSAAALAALPREEVYAWPGDPWATEDIARDPRAQRVQRMFSSKERVKIEDIAELAGVSRDGASKWRTANIRQPGRGTTHALPDPIALTADQQARLAAREARTGRPSRPSRDWYEGVIWEWLRRTERIDDDLYPKDSGRGGRSPSGRPPSLMTIIAP